MPKPTKGSEQAFLGVFLALILSLAFVGAAYVDNYMNGQNTVLLWDTDDTTEFGSFEQINTPSSTYDFVATGQNAKFGSVWLSWNRTAVYLGNETWACSFNTTEGPNGNINVIVLEIPDLENMIIDNIVYNITTNGEPDNVIISTFGLVDSATNIMDHDNGPVEIINFIDGAPPDPLYIDGIWYNRTVDMDLQDSIGLYQALNNGKKGYLMIFYGEDPAAGDFDGWACKFKVEVYGERVTGWSKVDTVNLVIGLSIMCNVIAAIYIQDQYDVGGYVKDIKKRSAVRRKSRKKRR